MSENLKTQELLEVVRDRIATPDLSFSPLTVQIGDLSYYAENPDVLEDLPSVVIGFGDQIDVDLGSGDGSDLAGVFVGTRQRVRIHLVDTWGESDPLPNEKRIAHTQELAERFLGQAWNPTVNLAGTAGGAQILRAKLVALAFRASNEEDFRLNGKRARLWVSQIDIEAELTIART